MHMGSHFSADLPTFPLSCCCVCEPTVLSFVDVACMLLVYYCPMTQSLLLVLLLSGSMTFETIGSVSER